ncbi:hypothetical protein GZL_03222 [Streptomyces sp. 769]|nr:hypothetical protein GZL_03222 [Streptomyces sp. 769]
MHQIPLGQRYMAAGRGAPRTRPAVGHPRTAHTLLVGSGR